MTDTSETIDMARLEGAMLEKHLDGLARLRIEVFRAFPYLYDGSAEYEERYLRTYAASPGAVIIGAFDGGTLVGAATALPLTHEPADVSRPMADAGYDISDTLYFGESVLLPAYRGRGIGHAFFDAREAHARGSGYEAACFCAVIRPQDHPRRPQDYVPLDTFWRKRGYAPVPGAECRFSWQDLDENGESEKRMAYWARRLKP